MRVAQRSVSRNYMKTLNTALSRRAESLERGSSGLKFKRLSDNVGDGVRAMHIQEQRYMSEQQLENAKNISSEMKSVDSNLDALDDILQTMGAKVLEGMSEGYGQGKRDILSAEIGKQKNELLQLVNAQFGGKYLFSGTNNAAPPFSDVGGKLAFNGIEVEKIYKNDLPNDPNYGKFCYKDAAGDEQIVPNSEDTYMDIGLGLKIGAGMTPDPRTATKISFSGLDLTGYGAPGTGKNGTQVASNLYDLMGQLQDSLVNYKQGEDHKALGDAQTQLVKLTDNMRLSRTDLGTRMSFIERIEGRLTADIDNMSEMESNLISSDPATEAINMKQCEYVWMAVLQMGSQILPSSLLDYMR